MHEKNCTRDSCWQHVLYSHKGHERALQRAIFTNESRCDQILRLGVLIASSSVRTGEETTYPASNSPDSMYASAAALTDTVSQKSRTG